MMDIASHGTVPGTRPAPRPRRPLSRGPFWAFLAGIAVVYALTMTVNWSESEDSLTFMSRILADAPRYHPNHLLFEPFYHAVLTRVQAVLPGIEAVRVLQFTTLGFGVLGLAAVFRLVDVRAGWRAAMAASGLLAVTFGYWHYSTTVDAYHGALCFALLGLLAFDRRPVTRSVVWALALAVMVSGAVLFHQLYAVFALLLGGFVLFDFRTKRWALAEAVAYAAMGTLCVGGSYLLAYLGPDAAKAEGYTLIQWARGYANAGFGAPLGWEAPILALVGAARYVVSFNPFFGLLPLFGLDGGSLGGKVVVEELYVADRVLGPVGAVVLSVTGVIGLLLAGLMTLGALRRFWRYRPDILQVMLIAMALTYALLATLWEAVNLELWKHVAVFAMILVFTAGGRERRALSRFAVPAVVFLGVTNFFAAILPYTDRDNDYWLGVLRPVFEVAGQGDVVVIDCPWICGEYIEANTGAAVLMPDDFAEGAGIDGYDRVVLSSFMKRLPATLNLPAAPDGQHQVWVLSGTEWAPAAEADLSGYPAF